MSILCATLISINLPEMSTPATMMYWSRTLTDLIYLFGHAVKQRRISQGKNKTILSITAPKFEFVILLFSSLHAMQCNCKEFTITVYQIQVIICLLNNDVFSHLMLTLTFIYTVNLILMPHYKQASGSELLKFLWGPIAHHNYQDIFILSTLQFESICTFLCLNTYQGVYPDKEQS